MLAGIIISIAVSGGIIAFLSVLAGALCIEHSGKKQNEHLVRLRAVSEAWEAMSNDIGIQLDATATEQIDKINTKMKNK